VFLAPTTTVDRRQSAAVADRGDGGIYGGVTRSKQVRPLATTCSQHPLPQLLMLNTLLASFPRHS